MQTQALRIAVERGAVPRGDFVFLSIDANGSLGAVNRYVLQTLDEDLSTLPGREELVPGYAVRETSKGTLVYIVTVGALSVSENLARNFQAALNSLPIRNGHSLWIPLMGTGSGRLPPLVSLTAILDAVLKNPTLGEAGAQVTISAPGDMSGSEFETLVQYARGRTQPHNADATE